MPRQMKAINLTTLYVQTEVRVIWGTVKNYLSLNKNNINVPLVFFLEDKKTLKRVCD